MGWRVATLLQAKAKGEPLTEYLGLSSIILIQSIFSDGYLPRTINIIGQLIIQHAESQYHGV